MKDSGKSYGEPGRQVGVIVGGAGLNMAYWIAEARREGYIVVQCGKFATLHESGKAK